MIDDYFNIYVTEPNSNPLERIIVLSDQYKYINKIIILTIILSIILYCSFALVSLKRETNIGFFDITASIPMNGSILYLDKYIIMPSLSCEYNPNSPEEEFFQIILYDQKNSGYIVDEGRDYFTLVNNIAKSVNLQYTVRNDKKDVNMVNQGVTALLTKKVIEAISILLLMIVIIIFIFVLMQKFHRDAQKISVNLICGASLNRIKARLFLHVIFCYLASLFISMLLIGKDLFSISYRNTTICLTVLLLSLISVILILNLLINNYQLGTALRRR